MRAVAIDLDGALGDTRPLWRDWLRSAEARARDRRPSGGSRRRRSRARRRVAGNWRVLLERFAEDRAPVYLRRDAVASAALRSLAEAGCELGVFTDAPEELARVALSQLGAARRVSTVETGADALERLLARLGEDAAVVRTRDELAGYAPAPAS